jgi:hypothetical protein
MNRLLNKPGPSVRTFLKIACSVYREVTAKQEGWRLWNFGLNAQRSTFGVSSQPDARQKGLGRPVA